ncbi:MAG TPA: GNAT family N-acetyltransferase [Vicinamibacterales bacterium]|nr:GNAT family N-acetyltransferase [Vicinamibacterales bacterium]
MRLRALTTDDLEAVRRLRNDNRHAFFDDREISADDHRRWFERLSDRPITFYVLEEDSRVVGTISVTQTPHGREIGNLVLDREFRGRGLMRQAVLQLTSEPGTYVADVKPDNHASLSVFNAAGFSAELVRLRKSVP